MSSVKNLLAMFENGKDDAPERGRSPGASTPTPRPPPAPSSGASTPRPISKIRTNFVAIEKDGRVGLGLARDHSGDSSTSRRTMSDTPDQGGPVLPPQQQDENMKEDSPEPPKTEPIMPATASPALSVKSSPKKKSPSPAPTAQEARLPSPSPAQAFGAATAADAAATATITPVTAPAPAPTQAPTVAPPSAPASTKEATAATQDKKPEEAVQPLGPPKDKTIPKPEVKKEAGKNANGGPAPKPGTSADAGPKSHVQSARKPSSVAPTKRLAPALAPVSTAKTNVKSSKSPTTVKTPTNRVVHRPAAPTTHEKWPAAPHIEKPRASHAEKSHGATKDAHHRTATPKGSSAPMALKKPAPIQTSTHNTGFVKPKPKSPTKPVRLPASLMAPTASSGSKNGPRQSHSRTGHYPMIPMPPTGRSPSRASVGGPPSVGPPKSLKRQSSSISRQRPSLGPPPKQLAKDHPQTHKEKEVDPGFLARMMRPTQSSASKVHDKVITTPPRKHSVPPSHGASELSPLPIKKFTPAKRSTPSRGSTPHAHSRHSKTPSPHTIPTTPPKVASPPIVASPLVQEPATAKAEEAGDDTLVETPAKEEAPSEEVKVEAAVPQVVETAATPVEAKTFAEEVVRPQSQAEDAANAVPDTVEDDVEEVAEAVAEPICSVQNEADTKTQFASVGMAELSITNLDDGEQITIPAGGTELDGVAKE